MATAVTLSTHPELLQAGFLLLHVASALVTSAHALLKKSDPRSAWGWIAACWLFPLVGAFFYYVFGINRLEKRARRLLGSPRHSGVHGVATIPALSTPGCIESIELQELARIGEAMTGLPLTDGNHIEVLHDGDEAYPAMLQAIAGAQRAVYLCSYIFEAGTAGGQFIEALGAAQARGVKVRVLLDGMSERPFAGAVRRQLNEKGVSVARFLPPRLWPPILHINLRNHRKLLIVDGEVAFAGGMNISDAHLLALRTDQATTDLHFRICGPVIGQLERCFQDDWYIATREALPRSSPASPAGNMVCRCISSGPNEDNDKLSIVLISALSSAHRRVLIMTPYFIPNPALLSALQSAAMRGVQVQILLPARSDQRYVDWASRKFLEQLLQRNVQVGLRSGPFAHAKLFVVDEHYVQMGSANMDQRSLRLNFELVVETYSTELVATLVRYFDEMRAAAKPLRLRDLSRRSTLVRLRDAFCWLFSPYL